MLLVIQLLRMDGFFPLCYGFFPVCHCVYPFSSLSDPWCYLQTPCVWADFSCLLWTFPVIHIWTFVHHSHMFRVVDVLCAVSYTVAEDEWIFSSLLGIFFLCVMVYTVQ